MEDNKIWYAIGITVIVSILVGWLIVRIDKVETMTVRSKDWYRTVKELEDHTTTSCTTNSNGHMTCSTHTNTRTINSWPSSGTYPDRPYWIEGYTIGLGHYERREESYVIRFSDDKQIYNFSVSNESWYDTFPVRGECLVGLNWFGFVIKAEC